MPGPFPEQRRELTNDEPAALTPLIPMTQRQSEHAANPFVSEPPKPRHPAVIEALRFFEYAHLPEHLQAISRPFHDLAHDMAAQLEGPQLTHGLQRLLEAKDCMVRARLPKPQRAPSAPVKGGELYIASELPHGLVVPSSATDAG